MRLTCPNCRAQYEVDDSVIPEGGRDVQCSACGHTWYQNPAEPQLPAGSTEPDGEPEAEDGLAAGITPPRIDRAVLDVLREEAEHELRQRRRIEAPLETQGDLGLVSRPRGPSRPAEPDPTIAPVRPAPREARASAAPAEVPVSAAGGERTSSRRHLLPDIEELSSTLEPGSEPRRKPGELPPAVEPGARDAFRAGLSVVLLIALFLGAIYLFSGTIARLVPVLAEPLAGYVALVDALRALVAETLRGLVGRSPDNG